MNLVQLTRICVYLSSILFKTKIFDSHSSPLQDYSHTVAEIHRQRDGVCVEGDTERAGESEIENRQCKERNCTHGHALTQSRLP